MTRRRESEIATIDAPLCVELVDVGDPQRHGRPVEIRWRGALKTLLRRYGFRVRKFIPRQDASAE